MLKWRTPLDGLRSNCLTVITNGEKLQYDSIYLKRSAPGPDQYLHVKPGQTVSSIFDVSDAYDTTKAGLYSIAVDTNLEYVAGSLSEGPLTQTKIEHVSSPAVSFEVVKESFIKEASGQKARFLERKYRDSKESLTRARAASGDEYLRKANYTAEMYKNPPALAIDGDGRDAILVNKTTLIFYAAFFNTIFAFEVSKKTGYESAKIWLGTAPISKPREVFKTKCLLIC